MKPVILHISSDYPDCLRPEKTSAVARLIEGAPAFRHVVYSLNRENGLRGITAHNFAPDRVALSYKALPKGLFWRKNLRGLAEWIAADIKNKNIYPDILHAHKFTVEGLIGHHIAKKLDIPLVCSIHGNTDVKILRANIFMRKKYREIARYSAAIFPLAPWPLKKFTALTGLRAEKCHPLPVLPASDILSAASPVYGDRLVSIFRLDQWQIKNAARLIRAIASLSRKRPLLRLDIYGPGTPKTTAHLQGLINKAGLEGRVVLKGEIKPQDIPGMLKSYAAFVLPSIRESYGLVFAEALFAGLPILYPRGQAIEGYFNPAAVGYACNPCSVRDIAHGMDHLLSCETYLKYKIAALQSSGKLDFMRREAILKTYNGAMLEILSNKVEQKAAA